MFETPLLTKVAIILASCLAIGGFGSYLGREIRSVGPFLVLMVLSAFGVWGVYFAIVVNPSIGIWMQYRVLRLWHCCRDLVDTIES